MATQQENEKIIWVMGNRQSVIIPMEREVIPEEGNPYTDDFYPAEGDVVKVVLTGSYRPYIYTPEVDGNLLIVTDNGTLPKGLYGVQITVTGSNGETRLRSFWDQQIVVTERNNSVLKEWDEFKKQDVKARAAVFFFAKGDKGEPFTYQDFTPEQIEDLKKPAYDAAAEVAALEQNIEAAEALRVEAEQGRVDAETLRVQTEQDRVGAEEERDTEEGKRVVAEQGRADAEALRVQAENQRGQAETLRGQAETQRQNAETLRGQAEGTRQQNEQTRQNQETKREEDMGAIKTDYANLKLDYASVKSDAQQATSDANDAAQNANDKAGEANSAAQDANDKGTYAKNQGDYAKAKANEIEDAKGTYQTLDARLDAMDAATDDRLEAITTEQLNAIFN